jgi:hypothetical protein
MNTYRFLQGRAGEVREGRPGVYQKDIQYKFQNVTGRPAKLGSDGLVSMVF